MTTTDTPEEKPAKKPLKPLKTDHCLHDFKSCQEERQVFNIGDFEGICCSNKDCMKVIAHQAIILEKQSKPIAFKKKETKSGLLADKPKQAPEPKPEEVEVIPEAKVEEVDAPLLEEGVMDSNEFLDTLDHDKIGVSNAIQALITKFTMSPKEAADAYRAWVEIERARFKAKKLLEEQNDIDNAFGKIEEIPAEVPAPVEEVVPVEAHLEVISKSANDLNRFKAEAKAPEPAPVVAEKVADVAPWDMPVVKLPVTEPVPIQKAELIEEVVEPGVIVEIPLSPEAQKEREESKVKPMPVSIDVPKTIEAFPIFKVNFVDEEFKYIFELANENGIIFNVEAKTEKAKFDAAKANSALFTSSFVQVEFSKVDEDHIPLNGVVRGLLQKKA